MSTTIFELFSTCLNLMLTLWLIAFVGSRIFKRMTQKPTFLVYDQTLENYCTTIGNTGLAFVLSGFITSGIREANKAFIVDHDHNNLVILILVAALVTTVALGKGIKGLYRILLSLSALIIGRVKNNTEYKFIKALRQNDENLIVKYYLKMLEEHPKEVVSFSDNTIYKVADALLHQRHYQDAETLIKSIKDQNN